ncbi:MAG: family 78 glycoside hydrolase catalytic domain [Abditibacteriota bacterium]|nr:family 78 glycoside hydrolase catalytic domain [Abditibacteriota bacterium]
MDITQMTINRGFDIGIDSPCFDLEWRCDGAARGRAAIVDRLTGEQIWAESFSPAGCALRCAAPLKERRPYLVILSLYDGEDRLLARRELPFSTGLFEGQLSFEYAKWISAYEKDEIEVYKNTSGWGTWGKNELIDYDPDQDRSYLYAKDIAIDKKVAYAQTNICSLGYHELYINGEKAGDGVLEPGFTGFDKRALYRSYDITDCLKKTNRLIVWMGNGLYNSSCMDTWGFHNARWRGNTKFIMLTDIYFEDGSHTAVVSDDSFCCASSYIEYQNLRAGERHDMTQKAFCGAWAGSLEDWRPVFAHAFNHPCITAQRQPAIRERDTVLPCGLAGTEDDLWVKFPVNMAGWAELRLKGEKGRNVTLEFRERGPYDWHGREVGCDESHLLALVKGGFQRWTVKLSGEEDLCKPKFTYYGFQYIHITGLGYIPALSDIRGIMVHTDLQGAGRFDCSWDRGKQLHRIACRTFLNNYHSVPTDCPHREKNGWTADGWMAAEYGMLNFDMKEAYKKWLTDMADDQYPDGNMSGIVPNPDWEICNMRLFDTQWTGAVIALMKYYDRYYGDTELLGKMWPCMTAYMDYAESKMTDWLYEEGSVMGLGDWVEVPAKDGPRTDVLFCNTCFMYVLNLYMAELAGRLGYDQTRYIEHGQLIKKALNDRYLREDGTYFEDSQTALVMGILFDIIPSELRPRAEEALVRSLSQNGFNTGLTGVKYVFDCLAGMGRNDLVKALLDRDEYPSYGYMLKNGATTVWETWDGGVSHDHPMLGAYDAWLIKNVGGIDYSRGRLKVAIPPRSLGIEWADTEYQAAEGRICVKYRYGADGLKVKLTVPEGIACRFTAAGETRCLEGGAYEMTF